MAWAGRAPIQTVSKDPYASALLLNADTGEILFSDNADTLVYPASVLKLMVLLVILEHIEQGKLKLDDMVQVTREAYKMGGSQVYLDPNEQFSVEELLYALMVQSANDAAVALAIHTAGSKEDFVALMNQKALKLGMKNSHFYSVHGLPPAREQKVDVTTARDFAILCRHLSSQPEVFRYTATSVKGFRQGKFEMRNHNHLLGKVDGCDGFKTGYFRAAGFSIAATAKKNGVRFIAIVMGSKNRKVRDAKATELLEKGLAMVSSNIGQSATSAQLEFPSEKSNISVPPEDKGTAVVLKSEESTVVTDDNGWKIFFMGVGVGFSLCALLTFFIAKKKSRRNIEIIR